MTQMVLPQTPAPGMQKDAGSSNVDSGRDTRQRDTGESRYESVSRAEQKRLDRQRSGGSDEPRVARESDARESAKKNDTPAVNQADGSRKNSEQGKGGKAIATDKDPVAATGANVENLVEMEAVTTPLTFADLQALLLPATGQAATGNAPGTTAAATGQPMIQSNGLFAGLAGGKPGQASPGVGESLVAGLQMADGRILAAGEKSVVTDPGSLMSNTRFDSVLEFATQQNANAAGKLVAEAQPPLRAYATSIDVPVNHAEWGDKLMGKLSWLTAKNLSTAEIHLTPPDMGPMEVRVRVQNDQANITVHAANPVVRDQLELNSHRLRDMLSEQGLSLDQFDVSDNPRNQSGGQDADQGAAEDDSSSSGPATSLAATGVAGNEVQGGSLDLSWNGAVDIFA